MTVYDHLKNICMGKKLLNTHDDEEMKSYNSFMVSRYISMCNFYLPLVVEANKYNLPKESHQRFFVNILPKRNVFFEYIKKPKDKDHELECISKYFEVGSREADMYYKMLPKEDIADIVEGFKHGKK